MRFAVYQGEDMYVENNLLLGELTVQVPPAPAGKEKARVRFTYDINGLLVIDVQVISTGEKRQLVFVNGVSVEVDENLKKQMQQLEKLKTAPKDEEANRLLLERAESLFAQLSGGPKQTLYERIVQFNNLLALGSKTKIAKAAKALMGYMDVLESMYLDKAQVEEDLDEFAAWFEQLEASGEDEEIDDWGNLYYTN